MVHGDLFGPWGRILIVVVAALAIVLLLLVIACFLTPGCLGYECVKRSKPCRLRPNTYRVIITSIAVRTSFENVRSIHTLEYRARDQSHELQSFLNST